MASRSDCGCIGALQAASQRNILYKFRSGNSLVSKIEQKNKKYCSGLTVSGVET